MKILILLLVSLLMFSCSTKPGNPGNNYTMEMDNGGYSQIEFEGDDIRFLAIERFDNHAWPSITYTKYTFIEHKGDTSVYSLASEYIKSAAVADPEYFQGTIGFPWQKTAKLVFNRSGDSLHITGMWNYAVINWKFEEGGSMPDVESLRTSYGMWDSVPTQDYVYVNAGDTTWWSFTKSKVYMAERVKITNASGHLPVSHYRGENLAGYPDIREGQNKISFNVYAVSLDYMSNLIIDDTIQSTNSNDEPIYIVRAHYEYAWLGDASSYKTAGSIQWRGEFLVETMDETGLSLVESFFGNNEDLDITMQPWHQSLLSPGHNAYRPTESPMSIPTAVTGHWEAVYDNNGDYVGERWTEG